MGASLLTIAVNQSTLMLQVQPLSRAGSLPQGSVVDTIFVNTHKGDECFSQIKPPADPAPALLPTAATGTASVSRQRPCPGC
ncbi:hypothetical protein FHJ31_02905 [Pseudomonas sp. Fig-3]|nr:hypothetical protein FHJ31_02905 [Pseudomonas sp. Fig-3]